MDIYPVKGVRVLRGWPLRRPTQRWNRTGEFARTPSPSVARNAPQPMAGSLDQPHVLVRNAIEPVRCRRQSRPIGRYFDLIPGGVIRLPLPASLPRTAATAGRIGKNRPATEVGRQPGPCSIRAGMREHLQIDKHRISPGLLCPLQILQ